METYKKFVNENYKIDFINLIWWLEYEYQWDYVESESRERHRFDWNNGEYSFWLNSDLTGKGQLPPEIKQKVIDKGIKIYN